MPPSLSYITQIIVFLTWDHIVFIQTKLAPLENAPKLTAEMLIERQKQVEANRQKVSVS